MTTDRELLEKAAKAAGTDLVNYCNKVVTCYFTDHGTPWNPLEDDGDALRLAVKLRINILRETHERFLLMKPKQTVLAHYNISAEAAEDLGDDPYAATRRAIVRAAAAIGESS